MRYSGSGDRVLDTWDQAVGFEWSGSEIRPGLSTHDKFDIVWPRFRDAMVSVYKQYPRDWWDWNKYVMDKEMEDGERNT